MHASDTASLPVTPLARYHAEVERFGWTRDAAQETAAGRLDDLHRRLLETPQPKRRRFLKARPVAPVRGLYLWGDTGRGKTWLVDLFYKCLPSPGKIRRHFHRFMADVHDELKANADKPDPLALVADKLADHARVICFDEFFVSDIADAMILGTLFEKLFARGVTLVATSNVPPDELYRDGLQRARFVPAIEQIKTHTEVLHIAGTTDYRFRLLDRAEIYLAPADEAAEQQLQAYFEEAAPEDTRNHGDLKIHGREIPVRCRADGIVWFGFDDICAGPRSQADYIEVARSFHTVLISGVPRFGPDKENEARRFIALVDEFYDRNVKLMLSASVDLEYLYGGNRLGFEIKRTISRLQEMQSTDYLASPHLP